MTQNVNWAKALKFLLLFFVGAVGPVNAVADNAITDIQIGYDGERTRVVIYANENLDYSQFALYEGGLRYVLDFDRLTWAMPMANETKGERQGVGGIQRYRYAQNSATTSRLVLDLDEPLLLDSSFYMDPDASSSAYRLVFDFVPTDVESFRKLKPQIASDPVKSSNASAVPLPVKSESVKAPPVTPTKQVIVIDAGHGGVDPGTQGLDGAKEKDINLNIAKKIAALLEADGRYKVVLTRSDDTLVDYEDRIEIARDADADLFISIHADSAGNRAVEGASVYTLSKKGDTRVQALLEEDDWGVPLETEPPGEEVSDILAAFMTRETQNYSSEFAEILVPELAKTGPVLRNSHRQANFFVLLSPNVPAVLLEVGFLTNPADEKRLISEEGARNTAAAVKSAIDIYFERHKKMYASN